MDKPFYHVYDYLANRMKNSVETKITFNKPGLEPSQNTVLQLHNYANTRLVINSDILIIVKLTLC